MVGLGFRRHVFLDVLTLCGPATASFLDSVTLFQSHVEIDGGSAWIARHNQTGRRNNANRQVLVNVGDIEYLSPIQVGNQNLSAIVDTGSFDLMVFSTTCHNCGLAAKYNPYRSSSHTSMDLETFQSYGSGDATSVLVSDVVKVGPFTPKTQTFWEVTDGRMPILRQAAFHAILGMGPPETPASDAWKEVETSVSRAEEYVKRGAPVPEPIGNYTQDSLDAALKISKYPTLLGNAGVRTFSVCMGRHPGSNGILVWADTDPFDRPDLFTRIPVSGKHTWSVPLGNVRLTRPGSLHAHDLACASSSGGCKAMMDSGTSLIAMPTDVIHMIQDILSSERLPCSDLSSLPHLVFELGGQLFSLPPDAYIAEAIASDAIPANMQRWAMSRRLFTHISREPQKDENACNIAVMESYMQDREGNPIWILGMPFFRKYYTAFHIGEDHASRALYVAEATDDCYPTAEVTSHPVKLSDQKRRHTRSIDLSKVHVPKLMLKSQHIVQL